MISSHCRPLIPALTLLAATVPSAAAAQGTPPSILVEAVSPAADPSQLRVRIVALNSSASEAVLQARVPARLKAGDTEYGIELDCGPQDRPAIAPGQFLAADCLLRLPAGVDAQADMQIAMGAAAPRYAFTLAEVRAETRQAAADPAGTGSDAMPLAASDVPAARPENGNAFLGNLSAYAPVYAAYGPGTNSDGRLQISLKYQLFGDPGDVGGDAPAVNGIHFGYTQRMFWDLGARSSPFRNIDFMPEIFFLQPAVALDNGLSLGGQFGFRHESNGRDGDASRSANTVYLQPVGTFEAGDYTVSIGPRLFFYIGDLSDNPDIRDYRGSTGLFAEVGQDDGLRLTTTGQLNFGTGKGALDAELTYPLDRIVETGLNLYLIAQGFAGYGENLLDYNRQSTRLRVGFAIVR